MVQKDFEQQYLSIMQDIIDNGEWIDNERTGKACKTIPFASIEFDGNTFPILTTKKVNYKKAIAEIQGYFNGYTNAAQFRELGTDTWDANANKTKAWLENSLRKGEDDMGKVYGAIAKDFGGINLFDKVINNLKQGKDDRGETITFWKPDEFHKGCLRPCMYEHKFILINGTLHLSSKMRSVDVPLGCPFNMIQCYWILNFMAKITGHKVGRVKMTLDHVHIYEDQLRGVLEQLSREPEAHTATYHMPDIDYVDGEVVAVDKVVIDTLGKVLNYLPRPYIKFPFSE